MIIIDYIDRAVPMSREELNSIYSKLKKLSALHKCFIWTSKQECKDTFKEKKASI
jgi:archaellum biogenesis ATPase FlaH